MEHTIFTLPSGATVTIESNRAVPASRRGVSEAGAVPDKAATAWAGGIRMVAELAEQTVEHLRAATGSAREVVVEFGVNISGRTGIVLLEGTAAANLRVELKW